MSWKKSDSVISFSPGYGATISIRSEGAGRYAVMSYAGECGNSSYSQTLRLPHLRQLAADITDFCDTVEEGMIKIPDLAWPVTIYPGGEIKIGCETAPVERWAGFNIKTIRRLAGTGDADKAEEFWRENRDTILAKAGWKESAKTYKVGDRFNFNGPLPDKYILAFTGGNHEGAEINLFSLHDGGRWSDPITVKNKHHITQAEFDELADVYRENFTLIEDEDS